MTKIEMVPIAEEWSSDDDYDRGVFAPVFAECTASELEIVGSLPDDLDGIFVQAGANPIFAPNVGHSWMDGDGMVHGMHLQDGRAGYRNRLVRTAGLAEDLAAGRATTVGSNAPPGSGRRSKNVANTDVILHGDRLLALWWGSAEVYRLSVPALETLGIEDYQGTLTTGMCSHPKLDHATGELWYIDYGRKPPYLSVGVASRDGKITGSIEIDLPGPRVQHDIALSERFVIVFDFPLRPNLNAGHDGSIGFSFDENDPCRFGLVDRHDLASPVRWFDVEPCWMWHTMCAWDDGDEVVILGSRIAHPTRVDARGHEQLDMPIIDGEHRIEPYLHEWRLNLTSGKASERQLDDLVSEFPRVDDRRICANARSGYVASVALDHKDGVRYGGLARYDLQSGNRTQLRYPDGWFGGEPCFAPAAESQDDGYLVVFVANESARESEFWIMDASSISAGPIARVELPQRVPSGFHTRWLPGPVIRSLS